MQLCTTQHTNIQYKEKRTYVYCTFDRRTPAVVQTTENAGLWQVKWETKETKQLTGAAEQVEPAPAAEGVRAQFWQVAPCMHLVNRWGCWDSDEFAVAWRGLRGEKRNCRQMTMSGRVLPAPSRQEKLTWEQFLVLHLQSLSTVPPAASPRPGILNQQATHTTKASLLLTAPNPNASHHRRPCL